jgi:arginyl-tRNA synthetase
MDNLIEFAKEQCEIFPEDSYMGEYLRETLKMLQAEPCKDAKMEKHTDRQIYDGCIRLMESMVDYFQEYLEFLGYDLDKLDEDERFAVEMSNMEIVRQLFLYQTRNSGGCSTRDFCERIGVDPYKSVKFELDWYEESEEA